MFKSDTITDKKFHQKETFFVVFSLITIVIGVVFLILGIVADHLSEQSDLAKWQHTLAMPIRYIGLIIFAGGVVILLCSLLFFAKQVDRVYEKEKRRKQRLEAMMSDTDDKAETVIVGQDGKIEEKTQTQTIEQDTPVENKPLENSAPNDNLVVDDSLKGDK